MTTDISENQELWLCGKPAFLRHALQSILAREIHGLVMQDLETEPPMLVLTHQVSWLVWFLKQKRDIPLALEGLLREPCAANILFITGDGSSMVRYADQTIEMRHDISLTEVVELLKPAFRQAVAETRPTPYPYQKRDTVSREDNYAKR